MARDNFDNPRFGLEGEREDRDRDTGIHFNENEDRLRRIEALHRIMPYEEEEEEFEDEPMFDEPLMGEDEDFEDGFTPIGYGDAFGNPPMVEMEA